MSDHLISVRQVTFPYKYLAVIEKLFSLAFKHETFVFFGVHEFLSSCSLHSQMSNWFPSWKKWGPIWNGAWPN